MVLNVCVWITQQDKAQDYQTHPEFVIKKF